MSNYKLDTFVPFNSKSPDDIGGYPMKVSADVQQERDAERLRILKDEYSKSTDPKEQAALQTEIERTSDGRSLTRKKLAYRPDVPKYDLSTFQPEKTGEQYDLSTFIPEGGDAPEAPSLRESFTQGVASGFGAAGKAATIAAGGLVSLVNKDAGDAVFDYANQVGKFANELVLTPEEQAAGGFGNKLAQSVGGIVPALMTGGTGALAQMAGTGAINAGTEALDEGATLPQAAGIGAVQGVLGASQAVLPPVLGKTVFRAGLIGGGINVAGGTMSDAFINSTILDQDQTRLKATYNPWDVEKRAIEGITGAAFGAGLKKYQDFSSKAWGEKALKNVQDLTGELDSKLTEQIPHVAKDLLQLGETHQEAIQRITKEGTYNAKDVLSLLADDPQAKPWERALAEAMHGMARGLGLDDVRVMKDEMVSGDWAEGEYRPGSDVLAFNKNSIVNNELVLHETLHAMTSGAVGFWADNLNGLPRTASAVERRVWDKVQAIDRIRQLTATTLDAALRDPNYRGETIKKLKDNKWFSLENGQLVEKTGYSSVDELHARQRQIEERRGGGMGDHNMSSGDFYYLMYGLHKPDMNAPYPHDKPLNEFITGVLTNEKFQRLLSELKIPAEDAVKLRPQGFKKYTNLWTAFKQAVKDMLLAGNHGFKNTILEAATDRVLDLTQAQTPSMRAYSKTASSDKEAGRALEQVTASEKAKSNSSEINYMLGRMLHLREQAMSKAEFVNRLRDEIPNNEHWNNLVSKWSGTLWENPHQLDSLVQRAGWEGKTLEQWTKSEPNLDRFMKGWNKRYGLKILSEFGAINKALPSQFDLNARGRDFLTSNAIRLLKSGNPAGDVLKWVHDRVAEYRQLKAISFERGKALMEPFTKLSRKDQLGLMDTIVYYQDINGRKTIEQLGRKTDPNGKGQWLSDDMLRKEGMNETQVKAYNDLTKALDYYWSLINQARIKMGRPEIPQIPGYMPHVWEGAYKVFVTHTKNNDPSSTRTVLLKTFPTEWQASKFAQRVNEGSMNKPGEVFAVKTDPKTNKLFSVQKFEDMSNTISGTIGEHLEAYQNNLLLDPATLNMVERIENDAMRGFSKHFLEQDGVKGWRGEEGMQKMSSGDQDKTLRIWQDYAKNISEMYGNALFVDEVIQPLLAHFPGETATRNSYGMLFQNMPELQRSIREFALNFTGENLNKLKWADKFIQDASIGMGLDPLLYRKQVRVWKNFLSQTMLNVNPKNWLANYAQPMTVAANLQLFNSQLAIERKSGKGIPSVAKSFADGMLEHDNPSRDTQSALDWARARHLVDPLLAAELKEGGRFQKAREALGKPNERLEALGREKAFVIAYTHMKQIYKSEAKARDAAANLMEMTMVNYDRSERPLMYQNYGIGSEMISPFAVFRNAYLSNIYMVLKHAAQNPRQFHGWAPLMMQQAIFTSMAGLSGFIGASEWDAFAKLINNNTSIHLPTVSEALVKAGASDWATFGLFGTAVGANVGSSMNAPGFDDAVSLALPEFFGNLLSFATVAAKDAAAYMGMGKGSTSEEYQKPVRAMLPPVLRAPYESYAMGTPYLKPKASSQEGMVERTGSEFAKETFWGAPDLRVAREGIADVADIETDKSLKKQSKDLVKAAVDIVNGKPTALSYEEIYTRWHAITDGTPAEFETALKDAMEGKYTTYYDRVLKDKYTPRNAQRMEDLGKWKRQP